MSDDRVVRGHASPLYRQLLSDGGCFGVHDSPGKSGVRVPIVVCPAEHYDRLVEAAKAYDAGGVAALEALRASLGLEEET